VTESKEIVVAGLELLGVGGTYALTNANNAITTLAGNTGTVNVVENSGFDIGTVNTTGLTASGNLTLSSTGVATQSDSIVVAGLELLGVGGTYALMNANNAITTLAGNTGTVNLVENNGFAIGTVNTAGLTTSGDITLSSTGSVTAADALSAAGLELLGTAGIYTLTDSGNAITPLAANPGVVSFLENSGFAIGSVNTVGSTTTGNLTLSSTGVGTESANIVTPGLELLGVGGTYTLTNTGNAITTLAGNTGTVSLLENSGFALGTVNTVGLTTSGDVTLSTTGTVTGPNKVAAAGLELLGTGGIYTLVNASNALTTLAGYTGVVSVLENSGFVIGSVNTAGLTPSGNLTLSSSGAVTETQAIVASGLELLGSGSYTLTNGSNAITTIAGNTGSLRLIENSGFDVGTVNSVGLTASGIVTLSSALRVTQSQGILAAGLELLGSNGDFELTSVNNAITTLAGDTRTVSFAQNDGFVIGSVNTAGLTTSGNLTLSSLGAVTETQAIVASGLELLGSGSYTLTNGSNAIATIAGNIGSLNLSDDSGFDVGTVNSVGLTSSGNVTLSSTGSVTQTQGILAAGLELLGGAGNYALTSANNAITTLAADTGVVSFLENSGFAIGSVNTSGITTSGNLTLSTTGSVTQSQDLTVAGLELLGSGGNFTLTRDSNDVALLALNTGDASVSTVAALVVGTVNTAGANTSGNLGLKAGGVITQTQPLTIGGNLVLQTTHALGDVNITNLIPASTVIGASLVGGDYLLTATNNAVSQFSGSDIQVAGDLTIDAASLLLGGVGNLVQGTTTTPTVSELRQSGVVTLGNISEAGNFSVTSIASNKNFDSGPVHGSAVTLTNVGNNIGGYIGVTTVSPNVTSSADVQTGIQQLVGTTISIAGVASFTAGPSVVSGSGSITLNNPGNDFGSLVLNGSVVAVTEDTGNTVVDNANALTNLALISGGSVSQTGAIVTPLLAVTANGSVTLALAENNVITLAADSNGNAVSYRDADSFVVGTVAGVTGIDTGGAGLTLTAAGNISQTGAIANVTSLVLTAGGSIDLDQSGVSNIIAALGAVSAGATIDIADSTLGLIIDGNIISTSGNNITVASSGGNLTLKDSRTITTAGAGNIYLAAGVGFNFINSDSTPNTAALVLENGRFIIYSQSIAGIVAAGLVGNNYLNETYLNNGPATQGGRAGNLFVYSETATLFFTADSLTRIYGSSNPALTYTVSGYLLGDSAATTFTGVPVLSTTAANASNVGDYTITTANGSINSTKGYAIQLVNGTLTVDPFRVDITGTRGYDGTLAVTAADLTLGVLVAGEALTLNGTGSVATKNVGAAKTMSTGSLVLGNGTGGLASNYTLVGGTQTATVTEAPLTIAASALTKVYDGSLTAAGTAVVTSGTVFSGDSLSGGSFGFTDANTGSANRTVTASGVTVTDGNGGNNYNVTYANNTGSTISPARLTI
jgi:hypothetical protein